MTSRTIRFLVTLSVVTTVTACTTTAGGAPRPAPDGEDSSTSSSAPSTSAPPTPATEDVPKVADPLDASTFVAAPCTALTSTQLNQLGVNPPGRARGNDGVEEPGCSWHGTGTSVSIGWITANPNGLADSYRGRDREAYFIETTVDGYPAVFVDRTDGRATGRCGILVAVSDTMTFYTAENGGQLVGDAACTRAKEVAAAALATVKAGA